MSELQGKFRRRKTNFATVSNEALQDSKLSLKAKGLYAMIQSYINTPDYDLYKWYLLKLCREGERAFDSAWKELKEHGYLKLYRMPGQKRAQFVYEYELLDVADQSTSSTINLNAKGEVPEHHEAKTNEPKAPNDHTLQNVPYGQKNYKENEKPVDHTLHFAPYAPSTLCSKHPVQNVGGINNNKLNNTELNNTEFNNTQSVSQSTGNTVKAEGQTDGQTDEIRQGLMGKINFDWIAETHPDDLPAANALLDCMVEMLSEPYTKIRGAEQSREALRKRLEHVDEEDIVNFLSHMRERGILPKNIRNISAYWKSAFINYLSEQTLAVATI